MKQSIYREERKMYVLGENKNLEYEKREIENLNLNPNYKEINPNAK